jgi:hypothetical protein
MPVQSPNSRFRRAVRGFYAWIGALVVAVVGPIVAISLIHRGTAVARLAAVVIGALAWVPYLVVIVAIVRAGDEYQRRLHLTTSAVAFAAALLVLTTLSWFVEAGLANQPSLHVLWILFAVIWVVCLFVIKWRFERQP